MASDTRAPKPMDPERLAELRREVALGNLGTAVADLLNDRDHQGQRADAAEAQLNRDNLDFEERWTSVEASLAEALGMDPGDTDITIDDMLAQVAALADKLQPDLQGKRAHDPDRERLGTWLALWLAGEDEAAAEMVAWLDQQTNVRAALEGMLGRERVRAMEPASDR